MAEAVSANEVLSSEPADAKDKHLEQNTTCTKSAKNQQICVSLLLEQGSVCASRHKGTVD